MRATPQRPDEITKTPPAAEASAVARYGVDALRVLGQGEDPDIQILRAFLGKSAAQ